MHPFERVCGESKKQKRDQEALSVPVHDPVFPSHVEWEFAPAYGLDQATHIGLRALAHWLRNSADHLAGFFVDAAVAANGVHQEWQTLASGGSSAQNRSRVPEKSGPSSRALQPR